MSTQTYNQKGALETVAFMRDNFSIQARKTDVPAYEKVGILIGNIKNIEGQYAGAEIRPAISAALKACFHDMLAQPEEVSRPVQKMIKRSAKKLGCIIR